MIADCVRKETSIIDQPSVIHIHSLAAGLVTMVTTTTALSRTKYSPRTMTSKKRPWQAVLDSDDEDDPSVGRQILPVANLPGDFNGEPMDGLQYLFMVR